MLLNVLSNICNLSLPNFYLINEKEEKRISEATKRQRDK